MPIYDFECPTCGPFTAMRPMAEAADPSACPDCAASAPRAYLTAPAVLGMDGARRRAIAANEKSRSSPEVSSKSERYGGKHGPGCGCCAGAKRRKATFRADGGKAFPSSRPWMISH